MMRKRLGQLLIGGVFGLCAAAVAALIELVAREDEKMADCKPQSARSTENKTPEERPGCGG